MNDVRGTVCVKAADTFSSHLEKTQVIGLLRTATSVLVALVTEGRRSDCISAYFMARVSLFTTVMSGWESLSRDRLFVFNMSAKLTLT